MKTEQEIIAQIFKVINDSKAWSSEFQLSSYLKALMWVLGK